MTREEEITKATEYYYNSIALRVAFEEGAQWADEHPKNQWRDARKELPLKENHKLTTKTNTIMTANEKDKIMFKMIKSVYRIAEKHELKYKDLVIMALGIAESIVRYTLRECVEGCKKNSRKVNKLTA